MKEMLFLSGITWHLLVLILPFTLTMNDIQFSHCALHTLFVFGHSQVFSCFNESLNLYVKGGFSVYPWLSLVTAMQEQQGSQQDRYLVRKALKSALSHLKVDHAGDFLSCHGQRVCAFYIFFSFSLLLTNLFQYVFFGLKKLCCYLGRS
jgi:hypothetical protein